MKITRRVRVAAPLLSVGLIAGSIFGSASTASAAPAPCKIPPCLIGSSIIGPDLTVSVTASPNPVAAGGTHTYVLQVTNMSWLTSPVMLPRPFPGQNLTNVRVHLNAYPSDEQLISAHDDTGSGFICYTPAEYVGMDVRCVSGSVSTLSTSQITLTMRAPSKAGTYTSTATVDPYSEIAESNENNNTASVAFGGELAKPPWWRAARASWPACPGIAGRGRAECTATLTLVVGGRAHTGWLRRVT